jgi:putative membrane protein
VSQSSESSIAALDASTDLAIDRTRRSYERTLLSWVRTATALITFGFSVQQFFRLARAGLPPSPGLISPHAFGLAMISIGLVALILATLQHRWDMAALQASYPAKEPLQAWSACWLCWGSSPCCSTTSGIPVAARGHSPYGPSGLSSISATLHLL